MEIKKIGLVVSGVATALAATSLIMDKVKVKKEDALLEELLEFEETMSDEEKEGGVQ